MARPIKRDIIKKLRQDMDIYESMGRHYRAQGFLDAYRFYQGKVSQCRSTIEFLESL